MLKTRMTELLGIRHPIMLAGMSWVTEPRLVAAVCNAGGLGLWAIGPNSAEEVTKGIREIRRLTDKPFGVNQALISPNAPENIEAVIREKVPVINYSLGRPWFVDKVHQYGGKVIATVAFARHAVRAEQMGADAVITTGHEAAGHGGAVSSMVLIPIVASKVKIPVIAAGSFFDGRGLAAALALGADGISMGTRFLLTKESIAHERFKDLCLKATEEDTLYSDRFMGMPDRVLKSAASARIMKTLFPGLRETISGVLQIKRSQQLSLWQLAGHSMRIARGEEGIPLLQQIRLSAWTERQTRAILKGDVENGILSIGQCCGGITELSTCQEVVEGIVDQAEAVLATAARKIQGATSS